MSKSHPIPEELIKIKAYQFWKARQIEGRDGTSKSDLEEAVNYLEKHRWAIFLWKVNFPIRWLHNFWSLFGKPNSRDFALEIVKTLGIGLIALGLLFILWKNLENRRLTQERSIKEHFSTAVEQLGKDKDKTVRIGGIYALEQIAQDSAQDHWKIMEVLTSYVRENTPRKQDLEGTIKKIKDLEARLRQKDLNYREFSRRYNELIKAIEVSIDVQTALTVIGRRKELEPNRNEKN